MIVERKETEPPLLGISTFNQQLDNLENVLHKMERYSRKLNVRIGDMKKLVATNQRVIARLNENEKRIKLLLQDSPNSLVKQMEAGKEVVKLKGNVENHCHLRRTCKVTNIREISWTHCKSSTNDAYIIMTPQEKPYKKTQMLQSSFEVSQQKALLEKVVEDLELNKKVKKVSKHGLKAMFERQEELSSNGPKIHRMHEEQKIVQSKLANPYL